MMEALCLHCLLLPSHFAVWADLTCLKCQGGVGPVFLMISCQNMIVPWERCRLDPQICVIFSVCMLQSVHTLKKTWLLQTSLTLPHNCYSCAAPLVWPDLKLLLLQLTISTFCLQPIIPITLNAKTAGYSSSVGQGFRLSEWSINDGKSVEVNDAEEFNKWLNQIRRPPSCFRAQGLIAGGAQSAEGLPLNASMSEHCAPSLPLCILITSGHLLFSTYTKIWPHTNVYGRTQNKSNVVMYTASSYFIRIRKGYFQISGKPWTLLVLLFRSPVSLFSRHTIHCLSGKKKERKNLKPCLLWATWAHL